MATVATPLSSQWMLMAQAGEGVETRVWGKLLRLRHCLLLPYPHFLRFPAEPGWPGAEQRPRSSWKEVYGTEHQGEGALGPRGEGSRPPPYSSPLSSQHRKHL